MSLNKKVKKWSIDLNLNESDSGFDALSNIPCPLGMKKVATMEGQCQSLIKTAAFSTELAPKEKERALTILKKKRQMAMGLATSIAKNIPMNAFMLYMAGKNLNMWTISTLGMCITTPLKSLMSINSQFARFEDSDGKVDLQMPKFIFVLLNVLWLSIGLYKMSTMRLLPTTSADWSGRIVWKEMMEISSIPPL